MNTIDKSKTHNQRIFELKGLRVVKGINGRYGLINFKGKLVADYRFWYLGEFKCGRALIIIGSFTDKKYGYLDQYGNVTLLNKPYSQVFSFSEDLAMVHRFYGYDKQMYGFIDKSLIEVIPLKFYGAYSFNSGLAAVANIENKWGFIDKNGNQVIPFKYTGVKDFINDMAIVYNQNYQYGFIDKNGKEIVPLIYKEVKPFNEGLAVVRSKNNSGDYKYGYVDTKGTIVIPLIFESAESFNDGLASVCVINSTDEFEYGYINTTGEFVISPQFVYAKSFFGGTAVVALDFGDYFTIDKTGKRISYSTDFEYVETYENGLSKIARVFGDYKYGIIDQNKKVIINPSHSQIIDGTEDCFIVVDHNNYKCQNECYLSDNKGNKLTTDYYQEIFSFVEGVAIVLNYKKDFEPLYGFINTNGEEIVQCIYEDISVFRDSIAAVKFNNKWGFVNKYGLISDIKFDEICLFNEDGFIYTISQYRKILEVSTILPKNLKYFENNIGFTVKDGMYGIIDINGKEIAPHIYEVLKPADSLKSNLISYKRNGKYGFINNRGIEICSPIYSNVLNFSEGIAACCKDGKWGFIDKNGDIVIPYKYFEVGSFNFGLALVKIDNLFGYINKLDTLVIKPQFLTARDFFVDNKGNMLAEVEKWDGKSSRNDGYLIDTKGRIIEKIY